MGVLKNMIDSKVIKWARENWTIIIFLIGCVVAWSNMQTTQTSINTRVQTLETRFVAVTDIQVQLSQIQTDLQWIKAKLK